MNEQIKAGAGIHAGDGGYSISTKEKYEAFVKARNYSYIKSLMIEAGTDSSGKWMSIDNVEKLSELIVKECADIATMNQFQYDAVGNYVLKHFGVEE